ncbi:MAG TPA: methionyl-tRNA formyltransferase, partial [Gemmatimonadaceae bacterium]|nr:methionyl-tRNA formyltransferase [Gemmatimonadaceae bacterium]
MRVLFWGTPDFATPPLRALIGEGFEVCGVVTQPDKPQGRHRTIAPPPVKEIALAEGIPVFQPATSRDPKFIRLCEIMRPDISVVVAYGHILPKAVIDLPSLGTLNIHASLLPALRGAAPIQAALRHGLRETGVSIMRMVPALDAGPVLLRCKTPIAGDETYGELRERLSELGALALIEALALISLGQAKEVPQDDTLATYAGKVTRETARIDWTLDAREVVNTIRAYDPTPGAFTTHQGTDVKLFGAKPTPFSQPTSPPTPPGRVLATGESFIVACGTGAVAITDVQPAGKKRMTTSQW